MRKIPPWAPNKCCHPGEKAFLAHHGLQCIDIKPACVRTRELPQQLALRSLCVVLWCKAFTATPLPGSHFLQMENKLVVHIIHSFCLLTDNMPQWGQLHDRREVSLGGASWNPFSDFFIEMAVGWHWCLLRVGNRDGEIEWIGSGFAESTFYDTVTHSYLRAPLVSRNESKSLDTTIYSNQTTLIILYIDFTLWIL